MAEIFHRPSRVFKMVGFMATVKPFLKSRPRPAGRLFLKKYFSAIKRILGGSNVLVFRLFLVGLAVYDLNKKKSGDKHQGKERHTQENQTDS